MTPFFKEKWQDSWWIWEFRKQSKVHLSQQRIFIWQDVRFCHSPLWKSSWCLLSIVGFTPSFTKFIYFCFCFVSHLQQSIHKWNLRKTAFKKFEVVCMVCLSRPYHFKKTAFHKLHLVHSWILGPIFSWIFIPMVFLTYIDISKNSREGRREINKKNLLAYIFDRVLNTPLFAPTHS